MGRVTFSKPRKLATDDDFSGFCCGNPDIDAWLRNRAVRARRQGAAVTYVTTDSEGVVAGFYALSAISVSRAEVAGGWLRRNVPGQIPCVLLGMLGVDERFKGKGLGAQLLRDAVMRSMAAADVIGARAMVVDPADEQARSFYKHYGFRDLLGTECMYIPLTP